MPSLPLFALCMTIFTISYAVALAITIIAVNFGVPNELRGAAIGINVVAVSIAGALVGPLVALVGEKVGGLGAAIALVGVPLSLAAALCFHHVSSRERLGSEPGPETRLKPENPMSVGRE